ncbi:MAG TPA: RdgB/HAM1 family non-canonical purine NTP pyrophosphatase [Burkholderiaceae bacterium]|nr:RdgB/HAM1 family non-canonical purine NTP pyrophosphatase [Burkholderiaceae bacterium]
MSRRLVVASGNVAKVGEISMMLQGSVWQVVPQSDFGVAIADEPHATFGENALAKARHAAARTGLPALADDSGLCVDALSGAPGVRSARFAGEAATDQANNEELLRRLAGITRRHAHYTCVLTAVRSADDAEPIVAHAQWHGEIALEPRGERGFGYDPLFYLPELGLTAAELDPAHKNRISHRGLALHALAQRLPEWL